MGARNTGEKTDTAAVKKKKATRPSVDDNLADFSQSFAILGTDWSWFDHEEFADDVGAVVSDKSINDRSTIAIRENWNCDLCATEKIYNYIASCFTRFLFPLFRHCFPKEKENRNWSFKLFFLGVLLPNFRPVLLLSRATSASYRLTSSPRVPERVDLPAKIFPNLGPSPYTGSDPRHSFWLFESCAKSRSRIDPAGSPRRETRSHVSYVLRVLVHVCTYIRYTYIHTYIYVYFYI